MKGVEGNTFEKAKAKLSKLVALEAERFCFLKNSDRLTDNEKERYKALIRIKDGKYSMDEETLEQLCRHCQNCYFGIMDRRRLF